MAHAVEANAWPEAAIELCFGGRVRRRVGLGNAPGERAVLEGRESGMLGHELSISVVSEDV